jgi:biopolymer transport protein ExbD
MRNENSAKHHASPFINVTPLIDVLLVLLIIFTVISPTKLGRFEAKVPEKPAGPNVVETSLALVVTVDREGGYRLNSQPAGTLDELERWLHYALDGRPSDRRAVFVKAPRALRYGEVVKVIDVMKSAGSSPIGLQIEDLD